MHNACKLNLFVKTVGEHTRKMSSLTNFSLTRLFPYEAPTWAQQLKGIPSHKLKLANLPTPIHEWDLPGVPKDFQVFIKRDDMSGSTLTGNKVRKLEFLLADAVANGYKHVITCGGIQSNHCRATAIAARQLGLTPHLVLRAGIQTADEAGCEGNLFLDRLAGAKIYTTPKGESQIGHLIPRMEKIAQKIRDETGEKTYIIPVGGSNPLGLWGYLDAFRELLDQGVMEHFDDIVFAQGSGGTGEGLAVGSLLSGAGVRIHGVVVSDNKKYYVEHGNKTLESVGLQDTQTDEILDLIEGYKGKAYAATTPEELDFAVDIASQTGIMVDPTYTLKAVRGMVSEMQKNPARFKGKRVLFLHTGGIYGLFDGRITETLLKPGSITNSVHVWNDMEKPPPV